MIAYFLVNCMCPNWILKKGQNDARPQDKIENNEKNDKFHEIPEKTEK